MRPHLRRSFVPVTKFICPAALATRELSAFVGRWTRGLAWSNATPPHGGVAIELLAVLKGAVGDLDNVPQILRLFVMVNGAPNFTEPYRVADGASELLVQVFGERSIHARSAASVAQVPFGACVEIAMIAELRATKIGGSI
jgi:hypothetical protein